MQIKTITSLGMGFMLTAALAVAGCEEKADKSNAADAPASASASPSASAPPQASASAAPKSTEDAATAPKVDEKAEADDKLAADEVLEHHRYHRGGIISFVALSLDTLGVGAEQQPAVEKIQHELDERMVPLHEANHNLIERLADGVAAGKVDATKSDADLAAVARAEAAVRSASAALVIELHKTLTPPERAALVDKVEAHWQVWREANADEKANSHDEHGPGRLAKLTSELSLTPEQVTKIEDGLKAKPSASGPIDPKVSSDVDTHLKEFATAFASEKFDAKTLTTWESVDSQIATTGGARLVRLSEVAAPILTPDQRTKFATQLREHGMKPAVEKK
jgi:Spy/CpxP family protein refolding chaperone